MSVLGIIKTESSSPFIRPEICYIARGDIMCNEEAWLVSLVAIQILSGYERWEGRLGKVGKTLKVSWLFFCWVFFQM